LAFYLMTGFGRAEFGVELAETGRYVYIATALLLPITALAVSPTARSRLWPTLMVMLVCVGLVAHNLDLLDARQHIEASRERAFKGTVLAAAELVRADEPLVNDQVDRRENPNLDVETLRLADRHGWLPDGRPSPFQEMSAAAGLQIALEPAGGALTPMVVEGSANLRFDPVLAGAGQFCVDAVPTASDPYVVFRTDGSEWRLQLRSDAGGGFATQLMDGGEVGGVVYFTLEPDVPLELVSVAEAPAVVVGLPGDEPTTICGAA
jgi:hypothetical protein